MTQITEDIKATINKPGRIGTLSTVDKEGRPNVAYFGSPRLLDDGTFVAALAENRTLKNLRENPYAAFFCVEEGPVSFQTKGWRLYLKAKEIQEQGATLDFMKEMIAKHASPDAAAMMKAAVIFEVTEVRGLIALP